MQQRVEAAALCRRRRAVQEVEVDVGDAAVDGVPQVLEGGGSRAVGQLRLGVWQLRQGGHEGVGQRVCRRQLQRRRLQRLEVRHPLQALRPARCRGGGGRGGRYSITASVRSCRNARRVRGHVRACAHQTIEVVQIKSSWMLARVRSNYVGSSDACPCLRTRTWHVFNSTAPARVPMGVPCAPSGSARVAPASRSASHRLR